MHRHRIRDVMRGRFGAPLRVAYRVASGVELVALAAYDAVGCQQRPAGERAEAARLLTMAAKTFERPRAARRLVRSARSVFDGRIVIADDSRVSVRIDDPLVDVIPLPFNSGVSVGRNAALDSIETEFVWVTDDDIVYTRRSDVTGAIAYLQDNPDVDLVGMTLVGLPELRITTDGADALFPGHRPPKRPFGELIDGLLVRLKVPQCYVARSEAIRRVRWDPNLRMVDHRDFFSRAAGEIVCVTDPAMVCYHAQTPFDTHYLGYRQDTGGDLEYLARVWGERAQGGHSG